MHIRDRIKANLRVRTRLHRWPFRELQQMIVYKAVQEGMEVIFVNPHYIVRLVPIVGRSVCVKSTASSALVVTGRTPT